MSGDVRVLYKPGAGDRTFGGAAPANSTPLSRGERERIGEFLDEVLMKPLHFSAQQQRMRIEQSLDTMTRAERVYLEIEMQQRSRVLHSFDYDPLATR